MGCEVEACVPADLCAESFAEGLGSDPAVQVQPAVGARVGAVRHLRVAEGDHEHTSDDNHGGQERPSVGVETARDFHARRYADAEAQEGQHQSRNTPESPEP